MKFFLIDTDSVKANSIVNYNVDDGDLGYAVRESQNTYLREILGDALLDKCIELASGGTIDDEGNEAYKELIDNYIYEYLSAKAQVCLLVPISFKIRNIGVSQDSDTNVTAQQLENIEKLHSYWETLAIDRGNRLKCFLRDNKAAFPELADSPCACGACRKSADLKLEANTGLQL